MRRKRGAKEENIYTIAVKRTGYVAMLLNYRPSLSLFPSVPSEMEKKEGKRECSCDAGCVAVSDTPSAFISYNLQCI